MRHFFYFYSASQIVSPQRRERKREAESYLKQKGLLVNLNPNEAIIKKGQRLFFFLFKHFRGLGGQNTVP